MLTRPHRRFNVLTGAWVLVSPHRTQRPWLGRVEPTPVATRDRYDPGCYLCPGNTRAGGHRNPDYAGTFVFDNDYPALLPGGPGAASEPIAPAIGEGASTLLRAEPETGTCRVVCFTPRHDLSLPGLTTAEIEAVIAAWTRETQELCARPDTAYVQVFENRGEMMGASNPHPHSQVWATAHLPTEPALELARQRDYLARAGRPLLLDYLHDELRTGDRVVLANDAFVVLVPWWAIWPFETLVLPRRHVATLAALERGEVAALADVLKRLTTRYDNLFETEFPYSMGFHQAPCRGDHGEWVLHLHFFPPLLRSATVRKFMVGFELLGMPQRDITPEVAAERLREQAEVHGVTNR